MVNPDHQSPNAIPPRTSSTGLTSSVSGPAKPVLKPVPEGTWIASSSSASSHRRMSSAQSGNMDGANAPVNPATDAGTTGNKITASTADTTIVGSQTPSSNVLPGGAPGVSGGGGFVAPNGSSIASGGLPASAGPTPDGFSTGDGSRWTTAQEKIVLGPYEYVTQQPGKDVRKQLIAAFNAWLHVPDQKLAVISKAITMLHNASLLVDDVEDSSLLRRGEPVAHSVFGVAQTLNSGNYVYFVALQELLTLQNPKLVEIYAEELCNLHRGQGMDLYWRDTLTCPTEAEYLDMVGNKTGGLFRLTIKLMQAESPTGKDCLALVNLIGLIFQIRDDYMNLWSTDYTQNKGLCEDLTEGKFSFPVIHSIRKEPNNLQLVNILRQKTTDSDVKRYAVDYMHRMGSFDYSQQVVRDMLVKAKSLVEKIDEGKGEGKGVLAILERFSI